MFGAWGTNNANNQNQPAAGGFGTTNAFGQPAQTTGGFGAFGQPQQNAQPATGFGAAAQPNQGFGGFGAATTGFAPKPNAFGTTGGFGAAATPTTGTGGFGGFGGGTAAPNTGFGQTNTNTATTGFGTGFGATNNNNTANNAWGKTTTGGFGAAQAPAATATGQGTANPPFQEFTERDTGATNVTLHYHSISCMPAYQNWSAEELRAQDYAIGRKTASSNVPAAGGFGANAGGFGAATGAGGFGQPPAQAGGFGGFGGATTNTTGGLFGNTNPAGAGTFGATTTPAATNPFGQNTTTNTNAPTNPFAPAAPATGTGLFGGFGGANTNTTNAFGANNNATKPGFGGFGNTTNTTGATGFGGFGANANTNQAPAGATNAFGQPNTTNAFGGFGANNANAPKPGFGAANTAFGGATNNAFGQPANNAFGQPAQPAATGFGATPAQGANTTGGFGGFGQTNPATPANPFGQPNQTNNANPFGGFGQTGAQQGAGTTGGFGGLFGPKPATPTTTGGFNGFGQQGVGATGTNPLAATNPSGTGAPGTNLFGQPANNGLFGARPGGLFGANNTTSNPFGTFGQPAAGGLGNTVVANPATNTAVNPFSSFAAFGQSTAAPAPTTTATTNLFGASTAQPPQQALTASVDQPFSAGVPMFELLPGKSVATAGALAVSAFGAKKQPNFFMKRKPLPSAKTVASFNASTLNNNLRGFAGSVTTTKPFGQSGISLMLKGGTTPSTSSSLSSFGSSFMTGSLSEKKGLSSDVFNNRIGDSVKKLTLDKPISNEQLSSSLAKVAAKKSTGSTLELTRGSSAGGSSASYVRGGVVPKAIEPPREQAETEKLEKGDYWIEPSEPILVATAFKDLEAVKGFKCGRVGYGEVQFLDSVNLTTVGAVKEIPGRFIIFEERECTVYPDESEKPPVGQGLNVRARITLEGCWATDRATREPIKDENHPKHVAHVRKLKKIPNTTFEKFEIEKGEWTFIVEHFSRYGLNADDDEEEEEEVRWAEAGATAPGDETMRDQIMEQQSSEGDEVAMPEIRASVRPRSVSLLPRSPHHRRTSANRGEENDADDDADVEEVGMEEDELQERMAPSWPAQLGMDPQRMGQMQSSLFAPQRSSSVNRAPSKQPRISSRPPRSGTPSALGKHPREIAILEEEDGMDMGAVQRRHASVERPSFAISLTSADPADQQLIPQPPARKFVKIAKESLVEGNESLYRDAGLAFGRSFRVGWGPGGMLLHLGQICGPYDEVIPPDSFSLVHLTVITSTSQDEAKERDRSTEHLKIFFDHIEPKPEHGIPKVQITPGLTFQPFAALFHQDEPSFEASVWKLATALFDIIDLEVMERGNAKQIGWIDNLRRRAAVGDWLQAAVVPAVEQVMLNGSATPIEKVFALLNGNQVERACQAAVEAGDLHLATLLAQAGGDKRFRDDMVDQWNIWVKQQADVFIDDDYKRVYALLAGNASTARSSKSNDPALKVGLVDVRKDLDWKRAFALHFWYGCSLEDSVHTVVERFDEAEADPELAAVRGRLMSSIDKESPFANPSPWYVAAQTQNRGHTPHPRQRGDTLLHLLRLSCDKSYSLSQTLDPLCITPNALDYRLSWELYTVLSTRLSFPEDSPEQAELVRLGDLIAVSYAMQLEFGMQIDEAILVLLHLSDPISRAAAIQGVLMRNAEMMDDHVQYTFDLPEEWCAAAKGALSKYMGDSVGAMQLYIKANEQKFACDIAIADLVPDYVIREDSERLKELFEVFNPEKIDDWPVRGKLFLDYVALLSNIPRLVRQIAEEPGSRATSKQLERADRMMTQVTNLLRLLPPVLGTNHNHNHHHQNASQASGGSLLTMAHNKRHKAALDEMMGRLVNLVGGLQTILVGRPRAKLDLRGVEAGARLKAVQTAMYEKFCQSTDAL